MPGSAPPRAYFDHATETPTQVSFTIGRGGRIGEFIVGGIGMLISVGGGRGIWQWLTTPNCAACHGFEFLSLAVAATCCGVGLLVLWRTPFLERITLDRPTQRLIFEKFWFRWRVSSQNLTAERIAAVELTIAADYHRSHEVHRLALRYRDGTTWNVDRGIDRQPLEKLGHEIAAVLGIPFNSNAATPVPPAGSSPI